jgi:hypothetical protein
MWQTHHGVFFLCIPVSQVDSIYNTANISLSPWVNYTFRVIAYNKIGESDPSFPSPQVCMTKDDVPDHNPMNLRTIGDRIGQLHLEWTVSVAFVHQYVFIVISIL